MKKATLIIVIIMALVAKAWAEEKPKEPTKAELQAEYNNINLQYRLNQEMSKVIAYENRDLLKRAQEIQAAIKKMDEAVKAAEKKDEKKEAKK
jgi:hypothetical protein